VVVVFFVVVTEGGNLVGVGVVLGVVMVVGGDEVV
jgi:hypothetical protein